MRKIITFLSVVGLIAGVVFLVFPIAAIPDETVVGLGATVAAILGIVREVRGAIDRSRDGNRDQQLMQEYEAEIGSLLSGNPGRIRGALASLRQQTHKVVERHFKGVDWREFERLVGAVLHKAGFDVDVTQPTRDLAARVEGLQR
jgi:hypothetical protein